ncbi:MULTISPECIES: hypothetical protein [Nostoc]|uniref:Uncharacterized protein n=1 Tax=Nostoc paludosum FACHB-159 TaxID=2692908 RepID=A0ABR8KII0_9NOSO|nr:MULTISPECIES: hypothetical protein [Nostoc]MBD2683029.1 hypothetical protein [Nostoc sp. FACHB-857]MBD2739370.1 hypothetical protein [Nostoc paludosum FACHB-159]
MLRMYGGTTRDWRREYDSEAVLLTILQPTEGYINGAAGILDNQAGGRLWFGVAVAEAVKWRSHYIKILDSA